MAKPLQTGKQSVNLAAKGVPGSRIRRDPPPVAKPIVVRDRDELDRRNAAIGIIAFALAIVAAIVGISSYNGWSPSEMIVHM